MVLLRVRERNKIEATVIEGQLAAQRGGDRFTGRAAVNEDAVSLRPFDEDGVSLADVEESDRQSPILGTGGGEPEQGRR